MQGIFQFKQFSINNNLSAQKLSSDAVLLGAWINEQPKNILDIGTGCGILSLMLAQKTTAFIDAVDIDKSAIDAAIQNISQSPWANRIKVIHADIKEFIKTSSTKYELIVCNPPYFINSLKPVNDSSIIAKHASSLYPQELFSVVRNCINDKGSLYIVIPEDLVKQYKEIALFEGFYMHSGLYIKPRVDKPLNRVLLKFITERVVEVKEELVIKDLDDNYTNEYKELTKDFYLDF